MIMVSKLLRRISILEQEGCEDAWDFALWEKQMNREENFSRDCKIGMVMTTAGLVALYGISQIPEIISKHPEYIEFVKNYFGF